MTWTIYINFLTPFPRNLHMKVGFDLPRGFREKSIEILVVYMYIAPGEIFFIYTFINIHLTKMPTVHFLN